MSVSLQDCTTASRQLRRLQLPDSQLAGCPLLCLTMFNTAACEIRSRTCQLEQLVGGGVWEFFCTQPSPLGMHFVVVNELCGHLHILSLFHSIFILICLCVDRRTASKILHLLGHFKQSCLCHFKNKKQLKLKKKKQKPATHKTRKTPTTTEQFPPSSQIRNSPSQS